MCLSIKLMKHSKDSPFISPAEYTNPSQIRQAILAARPRIEKVNRIAGWGTLVFGIFNMSLGVALFFFQARFSGGISVLNYIFNYQFWGMAFFLSGLALTTAFMANSWHMMRQVIAVMLTFKFIWLLALIFRFMFYRYDNILLLIMWGGLTALLMLIYLFFFPEVPATERRLQGEEHNVAPVH